MAKKPHPSMPTHDEIMHLITTSREPVGKREIAKAFGLRGPDKILLKALLKDMADEGLIDSSPGRAFHKLGGLPKVTVLRIADIEGSDPLAVPDSWQGDGPPPQIRVVEKGKRSALGIGDRVLARIEEAGAGFLGFPIRRLEGAAEELIGVVAAYANPGGKPALWLRSVDKRNRRDWQIGDINGASPGDLVLAKLAGRPPRQTAHVTERLGDPFAPRALSLIAIHKYNLPHEFTEETESEAAAVSKLIISDSRREDLTHIPIVAIDPRDARDHDDAIWAAPDDDPSNPGGYRAIVAIADVSFYVRPGSSLDKEARKRGNSCYFPDQVIPMLPHILSSGVCSLKENVDRAALVCHLRIDRHGLVLSSRFARARVRLAANIAYEDAQLAIDGKESPVPLSLLETTLKPLWLAWNLLAQARDARSPLELDLPERQVFLNEKGQIAEIQIRERLDAHRVVEDFMIAANVAAAKALELKKSPCMYRVHEPPAREKLLALKEFLATYDVNFAIGQVISPVVFNRLMAKFEEPEARQRMMEQLLRTQTQAYYSPVNAGHFGLALGSYGHFTSPIRRYADILVHRSLVTAYDLEMANTDQRSGIGATGLTKEDGAAFPRIAEIISAAERRAMEAERETIDRYVAAYLAERVGEVMATRITGVQNFGFFAQVEGLGGDGLVPVSTLGSEYFRWDEANQSLIGEDSGIVFKSGQKLDLRLVDANPLTGSLAFALPDAQQDQLTAVGRTGRTRNHPRSGTGKGPKGPVGKGRRGRPANIRHQSR